MDVDYPSFADSAVLANVILPTKKLLHSSSEEPLIKTEKIQLLTAIAKLFFHPMGQSRHIHYIVPYSTCGDG